jgi:hypothetical protein
MKPDKFEQRLQRQTLRQVPAGWREEILSSASDAQAAAHASHSPHRKFLPSIHQRLSALLWPHPKAWAGLAAIWIFILMLNVSMREKAPVVAEKISPPSPEMIVALRKQQKLFAEWMGASDAPEADRPKVFLPHPRSGRAEFLVG